MKIGIDLGGTKTEGLLIDSEGKELANRKHALKRNEIRNKIVPHSLKNREIIFTISL